MQRGTISLLLTLVLIVIVSGCTGTDIFPNNSAPAGNGVRIISFEPELSSIYSGEETTFMLKIKNMGSFAATGTVKIDLSEWRGQCSTNQVRDFSNLIAPDSEVGTEGEEATFTWKCTAPDIENEGSEGLHIPYEPRAVVTVKGARSLTSKSVTLVPTKELLDIQNSGSALPSELVSKSASPVDIDIKVKGPVRLMTGTNSISFPVTITVTNVGGGIVEGSTVELNVEAGSGLNLLQSGECDLNRPLYLWRGRSQSITCEMSANNVETLTQARIVASATYDYTTTASTQIEVIGKRKSLWPQ